MALIVSGLMISLRSPDVPGERVVMSTDGVDVIVSGYHGVGGRHTVCKLWGLVVLKELNLSSEHRRSPQEPLF